jgi:hypothetical protein
MGHSFVGVGKPFRSTATIRRLPPMLSVPSRSDVS